MKYDILTTILGVLSTSSSAICLEHQEAKLINQLNDFFHFDHNIFLMKSSADPDRYITTPNDGHYTPQTILIVNDDTINNVTGLGTPDGVKSKNLMLIVVVDDLIRGNLERLFEHVLNVRDLDRQVKIGIFSTENVEAVVQIVELFRWSWSHQILNIFCAFYSNSDPLLNVYKFNPFGGIESINITGTDSIQDYFPNKLTNLRGHPLRFLSVRGYPLNLLELNVWQIIVRMLNATQKWSYLNAATLNAQVIKPGEILSHETLLRKGARDVLYPHRVDEYAVIVPHAAPYSDFLSYLRNETWGRLFGYIFVVVALATLILIAARYRTKKEIFIFQSVIDIFNLLMNDNGAIRYDRLHIAEVCVVVPLTFTGLIVVNGIVSVFQSYLTVPIYQQQINTIDELFRSPYPIMVNEFQWANLTVKALERLSNHGGWMDRVRPTGHAELRHLTLRFNNSIAFSTLDHMVNDFLEAQKRLSIEAYYKMPGVTLEKFLTTFSINQFHVLIDRINEIIQRMQSAGLIVRWHGQVSDLTVKNVVRMNSRRQFDVSIKSKMMIDEKDKISIPSLLWYGWIVSVIVFVCEIIWDKIERMQNMKRLWERSKFREGFLVKTITGTLPKSRRTQRHAVK